MKITTFLIFSGAWLCNVIILYKNRHALVSHFLMFSDCFLSKLGKKNQTNLQIRKLDWPPNWNIRRVQSSADLLPVFTALAAGKTCTSNRLLYSIWAATAKEWEADLWLFLVICWWQQKTTETETSQDFPRLHREESLCGYAFSRSHSCSLFLSPSTPFCCPVLYIQSYHPVFITPAPYPIP